MKMSLVKRPIITFITIKYTQEIIDEEDMGMKKSIWNMCKRKTRYRDEHTVNYYRKKYEILRGKKLDYYYCPCCKGFHLTSVVYGWTFDEVV